MPKGRGVRQLAESMSAVMLSFKIHLEFIRSLFGMVAYESTSALRNSWCLQCFHDFYVSCLVGSLATAPALAADLHVGNR